MSPIRILFLVRRVGPYHAARFEAAGRILDLVVIETRPGSSEYPWSTKTAARNYHLTSFRPAPEPEAGWRGVALRDEVNCMLRAYRPDVVATSGWADPEYHATLRYCAAHEIPAIVMSDSTWQDEPRRWWKELIKRSLLGNYAAAIVAGTRSRDYLQGLGFPAAAIYQPLDVVDNRYFAEGADFARATAAPGVPRRFLCVARFIPKKNLAHLLAAYAAYVTAAGSSAWDLVLSGSGPLEPELRAQVVAAGLGDRVEFAGFVQYPQLPECYARAGALILPSLSDQWGLVVNEAMAAGLPVLVSRHCGCAPDLVRDGENGWTFDSHDQAALQAGLQRMTELSAAEWGAMSRAARAAITAYSPESFAQALAHAAARATACGPERGPSLARLLVRVLAVRREAAS